ncbi:nicotinate phosphoribosyltransferase [Pedobacter sp. SYP-B3415]|uniref:nicotinate phosphoribosyltransferase n=1 Tax=Pedobacter sp. SYP-B3415 TaxID=2496641 RepID=UPI00101D9800|nr:nicotinate phosphoribosyltransferase [Pedobacter sp. SYP-B3415]
MPVVSLLDNDFYKFTMQHAVVKLFPQACVKYRFINRGRHAFPDGFALELQKAVNSMRLLALAGDEKRFLAETCPYLDPIYLDFLQGYRFDPAEVQISQTGSDLEVHISGYWYRTILWEVPILSLISELFYRLTGQPEPAADDVQIPAAHKIGKYAELGVKIAEFGTRRRHSYRVHDLVVATLEQQDVSAFIGTSNVHLAMKYGTKPIGTHAHEWFMFHAGKYGYTMANHTGLQNWVRVYRGDLGIALSDTFTSENFFAQFDRMFAKLFDGVRHDSGDPLAFADRTIAHYRQFNIDPRSKTIIFSDALNVEKVSRIADYCRGKIGISFGIGTNFTNDVGLPPMNIVIKLTDVQPLGGHWTEVVKLSDEHNKYTGSAAAISLARQVLQLD